MFKIKFKSESATESLRALFGHCQLRVFFSDKSYIDVGRFSSSAIDRLRLYRNLNKTGCVGKIGDFCEFASSEILLGGEHPHTEVVNQFLSGCTTFQTLIGNNGFETRHFSKGIINIGHGVIVSHGAKILSGVSIGAGSVVAAGSVVVKDIPEFVIAGGVPAKVIKARDVDKDLVRAFWEMNLPQIYRMTTGKNLPDDDGPYKRNHWLVIRMQSEDEKEDGKFSGFQVMGIQTPSGFVQPKPTSEFMKYCKQVSLKKGEVAEWVSQPFSLRME